MTLYLLSHLLPNLPFSSLLLFSLFPQNHLPFSLAFSFFWSFPIVYHTVYVFAVTIVGRLKDLFARIDYKMETWEINHTDV